VAPGEVGEGLAQAVGGCGVPQMGAAARRSSGDGLVLGAGWPGAGAAAQASNQNEGVAAVAVAARVVPRGRGDGLGGKVDAEQQAGGGVRRELAGVGVDVDQDQAGGPGGDARDSVGGHRHQVVMRAGSVVAARTPWHRPPWPRQGQLSGGWAPGPG
jgi:hypothetical protein